MNLPKLGKTSSLERLKHQRHLHTQPSSMVDCSCAFQLRFQYANEDRLKIPLSPISNGAHVCLTCGANMTNEEKK
ncbi:hypothetical protein T08_313 [Trichinella sp. T8]|nr:hypothetical protein T08_313 [Trichinella sp. T8]